MTSVDLTRIPPDSFDAEGYDRIYRIWKRLSDTFEGGSQLNENDFQSEISSLEGALHPQEHSFLKDPHEASIANIAEAVQARTQARLLVILMDRHGFHLKRENGGLR